MHYSLNMCILNSQILRMWVNNYNFIKLDFFISDKSAPSYPRIPCSVQRGCGAFVPEFPVSLTLLYLVSKKVQTYWGKYQIFQYKCAGKNNWTEYMFIVRFISSYLVSNRYDHICQLGKISEDSCMFENGILKVAGIWCAQYSVLYILKYILILVPITKKVFNVADFLFYLSYNTLKKR